jgi:hypothetical protein
MLPLKTSEQLLKKEMFLIVLMFVLNGLSVKVSLDVFVIRATVAHVGPLVALRPLTTATVSKLAMLLLSSVPRILWRAVLV